MHISTRTLFAAGMAAIISAVALVAVATDPVKAAPPLVTADLSGQTPADLANALVGGGVTVSNVTYAGATVAAGTFSGGAGIIGFEDGVVLSSGNISSVVGPNANDGITTVNSTAGDAQLSTLAGTSTLDAAILEFDFVPVGTVLQFDYVFASDEYNEYVTSSYNDVFAFYVNGTNCVLVPGTTDPVSINTINNGNPFGSGGSNPAYYRNNDLDDGGGAIDTEMDGLTTVLTCTAAVNAGATNRMKLAIADAFDAGWDSNVFLRADSLAIPTATPTNTVTATPTPTSTSTPAPTDTPTSTNTPVPATATDTPTEIPTATNTPTVTSTPLPAAATDTPTSTPTTIPGATGTPIPTNTASSTPTEISTATNTPPASSTAQPATATPKSTSVRRSGDDERDDTPVSARTAAANPPASGAEVTAPTPTLVGAGAEGAGAIPITVPSAGSGPQPGGGGPLWLALVLVLAGAACVAAAAGREFHR